MFVQMRVSMFFFNILVTFPTHIWSHWMQIPGEVDCLGLTGAGFHPSSVFAIILLTFSCALIV
jgi:hypothetical protein